QIIRGSNDLFLVLDDKQRVSFVAQIMHHAHQLPDIARVQSNAWFVHDKQRVYQRRAKAGSEVHALDFAAAQRARRSIEREITHAALAEIIQARADFVTQHLGGLVAAGDFQMAKKIMRIGNRKRLEFGKRDLSRRSASAISAVTDRRYNSMIERVRLIAAAIAFWTGGVGAIAA